MPGSTLSAPWIIICMRRGDDALPQEVSIGVEAPFQVRRDQISLVDRPLSDVSACTHGDALVYLTRAKDPSIEIAMLASRGEVALEKAFCPKTKVENPNHTLRHISQRTSSEFCSTFLGSFRLRLAFLISTAFSGPTSSASSSK